MNILENLGELVISIFIKKQQKNMEVKVFIIIYNNFQEGQNTPSKSLLLGELDYHGRCSYQEQPRPVRQARLFTN